MYVVATAGHVDHGKSTLVRALTGMEPDRLAEEQRRGLTIDLGFAWTELPSGREVAFVDVPGHERFIANMLAGVGPAPVVCFVVAADKGWQAQSSDHRDALNALGVRHGLVALTRADRAPERVPEVIEQVRAELAGTSLAGAPIVPIGLPPEGEQTGLSDLVRTLDEVLAGTPRPRSEARVRLWIDRSFSIRGSGTVVTGSLTAGTLRRGDQLQLIGEDGARSGGSGGSGSGGSGDGRAGRGLGRTVVVRGLHSRNASVPQATPHARVALNLRDVASDEAHRGDALVTPDAWQVTDVIDVRRTVGAAFGDAPQHLLLHIGTAAVEARLRPFGDDHARLTLQRRLPLQVGDRLVLRGPGSRSVLAGALVLDVDPPVLRRRGAGARWAAQLAARPETGDAGAEVARRGAMRVAQLRRFGVGGAEGPGEPPEGVVAVGSDAAWWVHVATLDRWARALRDAVGEKLRADSLAPGLAEGAGADVLARQDPPLPEPGLLRLVVQRAGLEARDGVLRPPGRAIDLGAAEPGVAALERGLSEFPFAAPEADELATLRLGPRELAAAERAGRLLRLPGGVILLPSAPALAMQRLVRLEQPFTASAARQALDTTRRVVIPLLEHLDARGWTRRVDGTRRAVVR
ncbi:MAG: SelB C-terminal domain-containing protein [Leucobacter sp.]